MNEHITDADHAYLYLRGLQDGRTADAPRLSPREQALIVTAFLAGVRMGRHQEIHEDVHPAPEGTDAHRV